MSLHTIVSVIDSPNNRQFPIKARSNAEIIKKVMKEKSKNNSNSEFHEVGNHKPVGEHALLRNQRGPWLEITAVICAIVTISTMVLDMEQLYFFWGKIVLLVQYGIFAQVTLVCIRRRRRPRKFVNIDQTRYGKYPGPAPIPVPPINGWKLAVWARLQNSLLGDWVITPFLHQTIGVNLIRNGTSNLKQTFFPLELPKKGTQLATSVVNAEELPEVEYKFKNSAPNFKPSTVKDYTDAYLSDRLSPIEVAERIIENINQLNPKLNMICDMDDELIREQALESTIRYKTKTQLGPLDGVPCVVKDQIGVRGLMRRDGLPFLTEKSLDDAVIIRRLRNQGIIIIGMTNMQQVGLGAFGNNPSQYHGECRNPHNPDHYPGGSSSGTAAAIACGLVPFGIGTDGGGSVRLPSAICGLVGIKPTCGRVPIRGTTVCGTNGVLGPMASNVNDCALLYAVMAGPDEHPDSRESIFQPKVTIPRALLLSLDGVRIAVDRFWASQADGPIFKEFLNTLDLLESKGARVIDFKMPDLDYLNVSHLISFMSEISSASYGKC